MSRQRHSCNARNKTTGLHLPVFYFQDRKNMAAGVVSLLLQCRGVLLKPEIIPGRSLILRRATDSCNRVFRACVEPFVYFGMAIGKRESAAAAVQRADNIAPTIPRHVHLEEAVIDAVRTLIKEDEDLRGAGHVKLGRLVVNPIGRITETIHQSDVIADEAVH